ncbi:hypothetical protein GOODEAATRI_019984 [Goodea atripinnis]|uniref:Uncharacterized protein n=1 Tax=Goodea atripinnis TaxID=208336 RepID=A0ABV0MWN8_9TELE
MALFSPVSEHYHSHPPSPDGKTTVSLFQFVVLFLYDDEHDLPDALPPAQPANSVPTRSQKPAGQNDGSPFHYLVAAYLLLSLIFLPPSWNRTFVSMENGLF